MGCWMTSICVLHRVEVDEEEVRWCALWKVQWWRKLSMSVNDKDLLSWNITTLEGFLYMEGMLPGISSFQPRDMSFSGVNADTFSASIFTETFSLPSSKTEEMHIGHPCALCPLYTLHLWCYNITTVTWSKHHLASSSSSQISTTFISSTKWHGFIMLATRNIFLPQFSHFLTISSCPPTVSLHVHQSSRVVVLRREPNKGLGVWSPMGLAITPHSLSPKGGEWFHVPLAKWWLWSKWFYHRKLTLTSSIYATNPKILWFARYLTVATCNSTFCFPIPELFRHLGGVYTRPPSQLVEGPQHPMGPMGP